MEKIFVNNYLLDEVQTSFIINNDKYSIIIAGAGAGKTLTIVGKIKYLLEHHFFLNNEICCLSFTNETVNNLNSNIFKNCHQHIAVFTFHKLAISILEIEQVEFDIAPPNLLEKTIDDFFMNHCYGNYEVKKIVMRLFSFSLFKNDHVWSNIVQSTEFKKFKKTIYTFICLMKSNGYSKDDFGNFFKNIRYQKYFIIIYAIYINYESSKFQNGWLDFDDLILQATHILKERGCKLPFKMIIIDEFQDTSQARFSLIQEIVLQNDASFCVVGDDYQSIYHFSGCDLDLFLNFKRYYPSAQIYKLLRTYRNSDELVKIAGNFIQKNPYQLKKELISSKHLDKPIVLCFFKKQSQALDLLLKKIPSNEEILILGRNHFDLKKYASNALYDFAKNTQISFPKFPLYKVNYMTIHASKGLESDIVILLNVSDDIYGIPSKMKDEKLLSFVKKSQFFPFEEERRLFYVALTRTKSYIYLLIPSNCPSCFIKELRKEKNVKILHLHLIVLLIFILDIFSYNSSSLNILFKNAIM